MFLNVPTSPRQAFSCFSKPPPPRDLLHWKRGKRTSSSSQNHRNHCPFLKCNMSRGAEKSKTVSSTLPFPSEIVEPESDIQTFKSPRPTAQLEFLWSNLKSIKQCVLPDICSSSKLNNSPSLQGFGGALVHTCEAIFYLRGWSSWGLLLLICWTAKHPFTAISDVTSRLVVLYVHKSVSVHSATVHFSLV